MELQSFELDCSGAPSQLEGPPRHTSSLAAPIPSRRRPFLPTPATEVFAVLAVHLAVPFKASQTN